MCLIVIGGKCACRHVCVCVFVVVRFLFTMWLLVHATVIWAVLCTSEGWRNRSQVNVEPPDGTRSVGTTPPTRSPCRWSDAQHSVTCCNPTHHLHELQSSACSLKAMQSPGIDVAVNPASPMPPGITPSPLATPVPCFILAQIVATASNAASLAHGDGADPTTQHSEAAVRDARADAADAAAAHVAHAEPHTDVLQWRADIAAKHCIASAQAEPACACGHLHAARSQLAGSFISMTSHTPQPRCHQQQWEPWQPAAASSIVLAPLSPEGERMRSAQPCALSTAPGHGMAGVMGRSAKNDATSVSPGSVASTQGLVAQGSTWNVELPPIDSGPDIICRGPCTTMAVDSTESSAASSLTCAVQLVLLHRTALSSLVHVLTHEGGGGGRGGR
jgi:hypothetical protein